ncbi:unnamed protein product [Phaedon cochleariae]|uniref:Uncharacterized protein n=1 Tax=Phaedon cochleariae TaxID=80249 RepID=A0A9P0GUT2_PHACE|nr:unnamed protein product [Phaedon cochleariae]
MVQLSGRYQLTNNVNYLEFMLKAGIPEDKAKKANDSNVVCSVTVDDQKFVMTNEGSNQQTSLEFDKENIEKHPLGLEAKSTASKQGNVITVSSIYNGENYKRTYTFSEAGMEAIITHEAMEAKRIFKRL